MVRQLFWKELRESRAYLVLSNLLALLLSIYVALDQRINVMMALNLSFMPLLVPLVRVPVHALTSWRREWSHHHDLLLLTLPVRGWWVVTAKLCAALLETATLTITVVGGTLLVGRFGEMHTVLDYVGPGMLTYWTTFVVVVPWLVATLFLHILGQLGALVGRITPMFPSLITVVTFCVGLWLVLRTGAMLWPLLRWLPELPLYALSVSDGVGYAQWLHLQVAPLIGALLGLAGLYWAAGWLVEREIEA